MNNKLNIDEFIETHITKQDLLKDSFNIEVAKKMSDKMKNLLEPLKNKQMKYIYLITNSAIKGYVNFSLIVGQPNNLENNIKILKYLGIDVSKNIDEELIYLKYNETLSDDKLEVYISEKVLAQ